MAPFDLPSLRRLDQAHHLHPFTDHRAMHREGTHIVRSAKGCTLTFEDGRELLDGLAGLWCVNVGYGREEIAQAVAEQMRARRVLSLVLQHHDRADDPARRAHRRASRRRA